MLASIVIIVKKDRGIDQTLSELDQLDIPNGITLETIVVDASHGTLDDIKLRHPNVVWIDFKPSNPNKKYTIPEQRNVGINKAGGDIIVFIDANCIPKRTWLKELLLPILDEKEYVTAGRVKSHATETIHDMTAQRNMNKKYLDECPTINMAFKKEILNNTGYFDESFDYGSDVDFTWRAVEKGYRIRYCPEALITHDWGSKREDLKRTYLYGQARMRLYKKHMNHWRRLFSKDPVLLVYPTYILLLPITFAFPLYPISILLLVLKNRKEQNPMGIVFKHLIYGLGALREIVRL